LQQYKYYLIKTIIKQQLSQTKTTKTIS
jgi:hypothetical protein